jgi:hypothetical protein
MKARGLVFGGTSMGGIRNGFRNVAVPEAGAPMVGFNAGWNEGVRLEVAELLNASGTCGRCCGWSVTQLPSGGEVALDSRGMVVIR